jgi:hypothetical protein
VLAAEDQHRVSGGVRRVQVVTPGGMAGTHRGRDPWDVTPAIDRLMFEFLGRHVIVAELWGASADCFRRIYRTPLSA